MCSIQQFLETSPTIEDIDKKIQLLQEDIRTLESYRNAQFSIVSRLPSEVLSLIFEHTACHTVNQLRARDYYKSWLSVPQICRIWRNISLDIPKMWSCIYSDANITFAELLLSRSKPLPVRLLTGALYASSAAVELALQHPERLKEIELRSCSIQRYQAIAQLRLPLLERLTLYYEYETPPKVQFTTEASPGIIPSLRYLALANYVFNFDAPFFSQLRSLVLTYQSRGPPIPLSSADLVLGLANMEYLETLHLSLLGPSPRSDKVLDGITAHLPRLKDVTVHARDTSGFLLFTCIDCPSLQSLLVSASETVASVDLPPIVTAMYAMLPTQPLDVTAHISSSDTSCRCIMEIWPTSAHSRDHADSPFQISITGPTNFQSCLVLCSLLPTATSLIVNMAQPRNFSCCLRAELDHLYHFLRSLNTVQELHVNRLQTLFDVLSDTPHRTRKNKHEPLPLFSLPSLKHIQVSSTLFMDVEDIARLKRYLIARKSVNAVIDTLKIRARLKDADGAAVDALRQYVMALEFEIFAEESS